MATPMDSFFQPAMASIVAGDHDALRTLIVADPELPLRRSSCSHPTLLQMVACEANDLPDPLGSAAVLVGAGAPLGEPLVAAASVDAREVLLFLLEQGIGVDGDATWTPLDEAVYWTHLELAQVLLDRGARIGSLRVAAGLGNLEAVAGFFAGDRLLASAGPVRSPFADTVPSDRASDPQDIIDNAFVIAVQNGHRACAAWLLDRGARVDACPPGFHWRGTAMHAAVWRRSAELVQWLLSLGADPTLRDGSWNADAIGWAEHNGFDDMVELLRRHGSG